VVDRLLDDASSLPPSCRGRTRAVGSVVPRAHAPRRGTLSTRVGGCWVNHSAAATARNLEPAGHRGRSALPLLQRRQPRAGVSSGISLMSRTTNRSATWSDPLRPVHRQDVGACELPIGRELEHRRCRDEARRGAARLPDPSAELDDRGEPNARSSGTARFTRKQKRADQSDGRSGAWIGVVSSVPLLLNGCGSPAGCGQVAGGRLLVVQTGRFR
jgi:hypothetical protein